MAKKRVSKETLIKWQERVKLIKNGGIKLGDTSEEKRERIKRALIDYNFFCRTYFPHLAKCDCGDFQIDAAKQIATDKYIRGVFEWARGHGKSVHISCLIPLWLLARKQNDFNFMVLVSKSYDAAVGLLGDLQAELAHNDLYKSDFEISAEEGASWSSGKFSLASGITFVAIGRGQSPRGLKNRGQRPDYIVMDDVDCDELVLNEARTRKAFKWVMTALFGTMAVGRGRFILVGNRIGKISVLSLMTQLEDVYHTKVNLLDEKGKVRWKENYTEEEVARMRRQLGEINFFREYMNDPIAEGSVFKNENFRWQKILNLKQYRRLVVYTDPSWKGTTKNDYKATLLIGKTRTGEYHVIKAFAAQTSVKNMVEWHYAIDEFVKGEVPLRFYIEANLIQDLLLTEFKKEGIARGGNQIPITPDKRKKPEKYSRIEALQPLFERGEVIFNIDEKESPGMKILIEQLLAIEPGSKLHDDAPDALEGAIWILNRGSAGGEQRYAAARRADRRY